MGRPRKSRKDLPPRVYTKHGAYYYVHHSGKWQRLASVGQERKMRVAWANLEQPNETFGTLAVNRMVDGKMVEVLSFEQGKTKAIVEIILSNDLKSALYGTDKTLTNTVNSQKNIASNEFFIVNRNGNPYGLDGIDSNFRRALNKYREQVKANTGVKPKSFGIYDLKGKGATDMFQSGIALTYIQALAGHESVTTTEIYIKSRLNKPVVSNTRIIGS